MTRAVDEQLYEPKVEGVEFFFEVEAPDFCLIQSPDG
jgi:hypothetical protein